jgi:hypothetical protein
VKPARDLVGAQAAVLAVEQVDHRPPCRPAATAGLDQRRVRKLGPSGSTGHRRKDTAYRE